MLLDIEGFVAGSVFYDRLVMHGFECNASTMISASFHHLICPAAPWAPCLLNTQIPPSLSQVARQEECRNHRPPLLPRPQASTPLLTPPGAWKVSATTPTRPW